MNNSFNDSSKAATATSQSRSGLFSKVSLLLTGAMGITAYGCYLGKGIHDIGALIALGIAFFAGAFLVPFAARKSNGAGVTAIAIWTFISGLFLGPSIDAYAHVLGWSTVYLSCLGTGGVMALCGCIAALSGINFSNMGRFLMVALLGLIVAGIVNLFVSFGQVGTMLYSFIGMAVFAGFFLFDFYRLSSATDKDDTWFEAIYMTMQLYLDYINFLLYLLRFLAASRGGSSSKD